jgi:tRNA threonylcarbamoyl adenosine modification protein YeaZ
MFILGIDTTGDHCSAAIVNSEKTIAYNSEKIGRGHSERLPSMIAELIQGAGICIDDIKKISVCKGPGSFTGLRASLAFACGLALPNKLPVVGITSLRLWAHQVDPKGKKKIISVSDVRRGEFCWSAFFMGSELHPPITETAEAAKNSFINLKHDLLLQDQFVDVRIMARMSINLSPIEHPAKPLYSRAPDAKVSKSFMSQ